MKSEQKEVNVFATPLNGELANVHDNLHDSIIKLQSKDLLL